MSRDWSGHLDIGCHEQKTPASQVSDPGNLRPVGLNRMATINKGTVVSMRWFIPKHGRGTTRILQMGYPGIDGEGKPFIHWEDVPHVEE